MNKTKVCNHCKRELPVSMFYKNKNNADGLDGSCKECKEKYRIVWRQKQRLANMEEQNRADRVAMFLVHVTDQDLKIELERRGYEVKATKTIEL